jgi:hypothetical protein
MSIYDIDSSRLPEVGNIDPVHREQIEAIIQRETQMASTDAEALAIVQRLIEEAQRGMTWDEDGNRTTVHVQDETAFWDESQIEAAASQSGAGDQPGRQQQMIAMGAIGLLLLLVAYLMVGGRGGEAEETQPAVMENGETAGELADPAASASPLMGTELLALSDDLGVRTQIGQPATVEMLNPDSGASVTLSVINTPVSGRAIAVTEEIAGGQLVAQWVAGTVVNYVMGIPAGVMEQMGVGTLILIRTDTAQTYAFTCTVKEARAGQEAEVFFQDRPGVTLFPLPAPFAPVPILWCPYDPSGEDVMVAGGLTQRKGEYGEVGNVRFAVTGLALNQMLDGQLALDVTGSIQAMSGFGTVVMGLSSDSGRYSPRGDQFQATEAEAEWLAQFVLPPNLVGNRLFLDARSPTGGSLIIDLGRLPDPAGDLVVTLGRLSWDETAQEAEVEVYIMNNGPSDVRLTAADFAASQGGVDVSIRITDPLVMPTLAPGNRQTMVTLRLSPIAAGPVTLQLLATVWELYGFPTRHP